MNIKRVIKHSKYIGEGVDGTCYEMENGKVLKIFKEPKPKDEAEKYERFLGYQNDSILFPCELLKGLVYFKGYITDKAPGQSLEKTYMDVNLVDLGRALVKLDKDINMISKASIIVSDVHEANVFFDGNKVTLIDPDRYYFYSYDYDKTRDTNLRRIENMLYDLIKESVKDYERRSEVIREFRSLLLYDIDTSTLLFIFRNILTKYAEMECTTIREYQRVLGQKTR